MSPTIIVGGLIALVFFALGATILADTIGNADSASRIQGIIITLIGPVVLAFLALLRNEQTHSVALDVRKRVDQVGEELNSPLDNRVKVAAAKVVRDMVGYPSRVKPGVNSVQDDLDNPATGNPEKAKIDTARVEEASRTSRATRDVVDDG